MTNKTFEKSWYKHTFRKRQLNGMSLILNGECSYMEVVIKRIVRAEQAGKEEVAYFNGKNAWEEIARLV